MMLSERNQTQNATECVIPYVTFWKRQTCRDTNQISGCQELGMGAGMPIQGIRGHLGFDGNVLCRDCAGNCLAVNICQNSGNSLFKR